MNNHWINYSFLVFTLLGGVNITVVAQTRCAINLDSAETAAYRSWRATLQAVERINARTAITIPVVVHVVYRTPEENISDAQIQSQIDALNRAYDNPANIPSGVPREFADRQAIPGIRFCLASRDPDGQASEGITRTETTLENIGLLFGEGQRRSIHYDHLGGADAWDPARYFNIWVGELGGLLGRATMPGTDFIPEEDGIIVAPEVFGTTGTVIYPFHQGKTAVHETGHYLGLSHLWGMVVGDCNEDDGLADTPLQSGPYQGCPEYPQSSCGSSDLFMDYMDFSDDACLLLFTRDQVALMLSTLTQYRSGLLQSPLCTGDPSWTSIGQHAFVMYAPDRRQLEINWQHPGEAVYDIRVWDVAGRLVVRQKGFGYTPWIVPVANWVSGIYFVQIISSGNQITQKVLIY